MFLVCGLVFVGNFGPVFFPGFVGGMTCDFYKGGWNYFDFDFGNYFGSFVAQFYHFPSIYVGSNTLFCLVLVFAHVWEMHVLTVAVKRTEILHDVLTVFLVNLVWRKVFWSL